MAVSDGSRGERGLNDQPPHPATVAQPKAPHPATVAQPRAPHPATVMGVRPPHRAAVPGTPIAGNPAVQAKGNKKKKRQEARNAAYAERMAQRGLDQALGRPFREELEIRGRSAHYLQALVDAAEDLAILDRRAWFVGVWAALPTLPEDRYVPTPVSARLGIPAVTTVGYGKVQVRYDPDEVELDDDDDDDEWVGRLASTFTHELAVHGNTAGEDPEDEHDGMHAPGERDAYLEACHRAFNRLANDGQQRAFVAEWHSDMMDQIDESNVSGGSKRKRRAWVDEQRDEMLDAIAHPGRHQWTGE